jgi:hypothetical protein
MLVLVRHTHHTHTHITRPHIHAVLLLCAAPVAPYDNQTGIIVGVSVAAAAVATALLLGWWWWARRQLRQKAPCLVPLPPGKCFDSDSGMLVVMRPQDTNNLVDIPGLSKGVSVMFSRCERLTRSHVASGM